MEKNLKKTKSCDSPSTDPRKKYLSVRKRASFLASESKASLTLEAALILPLFIFACVVMMQPFIVIGIDGKVQSALEQVSHEIAMDAYISPSDTDGKEIATQAAAFTYAEMAVRSTLSDLPVRNISLSGSSLLKDGETVDLIVEYDVPLPLALFGLNSIHRTNRAYRRAWVGRDGFGDGTGAGENDEQIVYIGKTSTRYHILRTCHYLFNDMSQVPLDEIGEYRNTSGAKYYPCSRCGSDAAGLVYIMKAGSHYHSTKDCPAIQAYVTAVPLSQVEYLGPCSYCSGGK